MIAFAYRALTDLGSPLLRRHLAARVKSGKEEPARLDERFGIAGLARPAGRLGWLHAASVGEMQSLLVLIAGLAAREPALNFLVTTGTVTSARLFASRAPANALHQYLPLDRAAWVGRFLDHWRPDFAIFVESEFWPNLLAATAARRIPMALVNGRLSARSLAAWRWAGPFIRQLVAKFAVVLAQDAIQAARLSALGVRAPLLAGNLKFAAAPLPVDEAALTALRETLAGRDLWLAASTHPGEEAVVADVHRALSRHRPRLLTIVAPRHAERGAAIAAQLEAAGLAVARRSQNDPVGPMTQIYLADTLGELGLFYRLAPVAFVAGSYHWEGHNPIEPARLDCAVISGPRVANFQDIFDRMAKAGAITIATEAELAAAVDRLLTDPGTAARSARMFAEAEAAGILERVLGALDPVVAIKRGDQGRARSQGA